MKTQKKLAYETKTANKTKTSTKQECSKRLLSPKSGTATSSPIRATASRIFEYLREELGQSVKCQELDLIYGET